MRFRLKPKTGSHAETIGKGKDAKVVTYTAAEGHVFETENDLCEMFPNKFERVVVGEDIAPPSPSAQRRAAKPTAKASPLGDDVTKDFPTAVKNDFRVFAKGKAFSVAEPDEVGTAINPDPLEKGKVEKFIDDYLG